MKILTLSQGSSAWLDYRKTKITATDISVILEIDPWTSPYTLWQRKTGAVPEKQETEAMTRGRLLEEEARSCFEELSGTHIMPAVVESEEYPWLMASLDGLSLDGDLLVEIKCGASSFAQAEKGIIPCYYKAQMQAQMLCTGLSECHYFCYNGTSSQGIWLRELRDEAMIEKIIVKGAIFHEAILTLTAPFMSEKDYLRIESDESYQAAVDWLEAKRQLNAAMNREKQCKEILASFGDDGNFEIVKDGKSILKGTRIAKIGSVDWKKICTKFEISDAEVNKYREKTIGYYRISEK